MYIHRSISRHCAILIRVILMAVGSIFACTPSIGAEANKYVEVTKVPCDRLGAFTVADLAGKDKSLKLSIIKAGDKTGKLPVLEFRNSRLAGSAPSLVSMIALTDFSSITFDAWSEKDTMLTVLFQDSDKCSFHVITTMKTGIWQRISLTPKDFQVNDDAPIKKPAVEPLKLRLGMLITDMGAMMGQSSPNAIRISGLEIAYAPVDVVNLPTVLDGQTLEISSNSILNGNTIMKNGGAIKVSAPHVILNGNILIDKCTLEFNDTILTMKSRFAHERTIGAGTGSVVRFNRCTVIADQAIGLQITNDARLEVDQSDCAAAGWTVGVDKGASVNMNKAKKFGEFIVSTGAEFKIQDSDLLLIWLVPAGTNPVNLSLPSQPVSTGWSLPAENGFDISLRNCTEVKWGLISTPGTKVKVLNSQMLAVGLLFAGNTKQLMVGIRNKQPAARLKIPASDRLLEFEGCTVGAWNFYAYGSSNITLKNCTVGEVFSVENSRMTLDSSTIDGTGGYVKASGHSVMRMLNSKTTCNVVADQDASLEISGSAIIGSLSAAGNAKVLLKQSTVSGLTSKLDKATITILKDAQRKAPVKK
ncbi:MAG: hypothetical protein ACYC0V_16820 [Armatimonadota bacterium]